MKKNLRIVSAAAAALLAVAPIATTVVSNNTSVVKAATNEGTNVVDVTNSNTGLTKQEVANISDLALSYSIQATTPDNSAKDNGTLHANILTQVGGKVLTTAVNPEGKASDTTKVYKESDNTQVTALNKLQAQTKYYMTTSNVAYNLGLENAHKTETLYGVNGSTFKVGNDYYKTLTVETDGLGTIHLDKASLISGQKTDGTKTTFATNNGRNALPNQNVLVQSNTFLAIDKSLEGTLAYYSNSNGNRVDGNVNLNIPTQKNTSSVKAIQTAFNNGYKLSWAHNAKLENNNAISPNEFATKLNSYTTTDDLVAQLRSAGIKVDDQGNFTIPSKPVTIVWNAEGSNGATATMTTIISFNNSDNVDLSGYPRITVKAGKDNGKVLTGDSVKDNTVAAPSDVAKLPLNANLSDYAAKVKNLFSATFSNSNQTGIDVSVDTSNVKADQDGVYQVVVSATNGDKKTSKVYFDVTVGEGVAKPAEKTGEVKVMHNSYIYNKDYKRVGTGKIATYSEISVYGTATINGKKFYRISSTKDQYIDAENVDGVKRTLKHNAYVYATSKRRANKTVMKKGTEVVTYGSAVKFSNGKYYYRIQGCTAAHKMYIKKANF